MKDPQSAISHDFCESHCTFPETSEPNVFHQGVIRQPWFHLSSIKFPFFVFVSQFCNVKTDQYCQEVQLLPVNRDIEAHVSLNLVAGSFPVVFFPLAERHASCVFCFRALRSAK